MKKPSLFLVSIIVLTFIFNSPVLQRFSPQAKANPEEQIDPGATTAIFQNKIVSIPPLDETSPPTTVLGDSSAEKRIAVDLTEQHLYAFENNQLVYNFPISSGKWGRTPVGEFEIWIKLRYTKMEGGSKALNTYYYLPNVPYVMFFYNADIPKIRGYGLHGTYWHNNFGHPMSHGCINLKTEDAGTLYYWVRPDLGEKTSIYASADNPGTKITIFGEAPWE